MFLFKLPTWQRIMGWGTVVLLPTGLFLALTAPPDAFQGPAARIMYVHVPSAWTAMFAGVVLFFNSVMYLWRRHKSWDTAAHATAGIGAVFTVLALLGGSIWGKPIWGVWWTWDARLTATAVLLMIYVGYLMLRAFLDDPEKEARFAAVVGIVGMIDVPIIHFSVKWWRTLHQAPSVMKPDVPSMPFEMLLPLLVMTVAFTVFFHYLLFLRMQLLQKEKLIEAQRQAVLREVQL